MSTWRYLLDRRCIFISRISCRTYSNVQNLNVLFFGTDEFSLFPLITLDRLRNNGDVQCLSVVSSEANASKKEKLCAVTKYATKHKIHQFEWNQLQHQPSLAEQYDLAIVASFGDFIPAKVVKKFSRGAVNIHPSLLPRWRGAAPLIHTILNGDRISGVSFIEVSTKKFDVGKILFQHKIEVPSKCTTEELRDIMASQASDLLPYVIKNIEELRLNAVEQDETTATHAPKITKETGYINLHEYGCEEIERMHLALSERVGIHLMWDDKRVRLVNIAEVDCQNDDKIPGSFMYNKKEKILWIKCLDGWIGVDKFQVEKKKKSINASSFYNGYIIDKKSGKQKHHIHFRTIST